MKHTPRLEGALQTAGEYHATQFRKGSRKLPYLTHLVSVATIVSLYTDDEDVVVAALLHDIVEDTEYTFEQLEAAFGRRVREIVEGVTEPQAIEGRHLTWNERKQAYVDALKTAPLESLLVAAADKVHNLESMVAEYENEPERYWREFSGDVRSRENYYSAIVEAIAVRLKSPIVKQLQDTFARYQLFLRVAQSH